MCLRVEARTAEVGLQEFLSQATCPYTAVRECVGLLRAAGGWEKVDMEGSRRKAEWAMEMDRSKEAATAPMVQRYATFDGSSVVAWSHSAALDVDKPWSLLLVSTHTDSPCVRIRQKGGVIEKGYKMLNTELYGGGLWSRWFDRPLGVSGRVYSGCGASTPDGPDSLKRETGEPEDTETRRLAGALKCERRIVQSHQPVAVIPSLAIHFDGGDEFKLNKEEHMRALVGPAGAKDHQWYQEWLCSLSGFPLSAHLNADLFLHEKRSPTILGDLFLGGRLDNLASTYCALTGLIQSCKDKQESKSHAQTQTIVMVAAFDHEECGSASSRGADSVWLPDLLSTYGYSRNATPCDRRRSWHLSADMAHAVHPNYPNKHQAQHTPVINRGVTVKVNYNQSYATDAAGITLVHGIAAAASPQLPTQTFHSRNDMRCGMTVGNIIGKKLNLPSVDIGIPQLSMHSPSETTGIHDIRDYQTFFTRFYTFGDQFAITDTTEN